MMAVESQSLPTGWIWTNIGEICEVIRGASPRPKGDPRYFGGNIPWIMISDISKEQGKFISKTRDKVTEEGAKKSRYLKAGSLILSNSGTVCVPKILAVNGCIHDGFVAFPNFSENLEMLYLYYYFQHIRQKIINENRQGVTQVNLNTGIVREIAVPLAPLSEQQRIVTKVEELFSFLEAGTGSLRKVQAQLKRYRQVVLKYAYEAKLAEKHFWTNFNSVVESYQNGFSKRWSDKGKEIPVLRLADLEDGAIVARSPRRIKLTNDEQRKYLLNKDDLLCIRVNGSKNNTGRLVVFDKTEPWAFCDHLIRIRLKSGVNSQYVKQYFNTQIARKSIESRIISSAGQNTISQTSLDKIPFPIVPVEEQIAINKRIEYFFSIIKYNETTIENCLDQSSLLRQSILKKAFSGKLAPQDSRDASAEKLLERIKAERSSGKSKNNNQVELYHYVK